MKSEKLQSIDRSSTELTDIEIWAQQLMIYCLFRIKKKKLHDFICS